MIYPEFPRHREKFVPITMYPTHGIVSEMGTATHFPHPSRLWLSKAVTDCALPLRMYQGSAFYAGMTCPVVSTHPQ